MVRVKYRFLISQILLDVSSSIDISIQGNDILNCLREKIQLLFGDIIAGVMTSSLSIKFYDNFITQITVIRISREYYSNCNLALSLIQQLGKSNSVSIPVTIRTLRICSCLRTCAIALESFLNEATSLDIRSYSTAVDRNELIEFYRKNVADLKEGK